MEIWEDKTLQNGRAEKEFSDGYLIKSISGKMVEIPFKYENKTPRNYTLTSASLPGLEYSQPTETIYTSRLDLNFAQGDKIRLVDDRTLTVKDLNYKFDNARALWDGDGRIGVYLTLKGGG